MAPQKETLRNSCLLMTTLFDRLPPQRPRQRVNRLRELMNTLSRVKYFLPP